MKQFLVICLIVISAFTARADNIDTKEVERRINQLMQRPEMTGLAVAIVENGEVVFAKGFGLRDRSRRDKVDENTVFRWASLSKAVGATAAMQLAEEGMLELQMPISNYAPSLVMPGSEYETTLEDILSQRTGIAHNAYDRRIEAGQQAKFVRRALGGVDRLCEPGACHSYQNVAFDAAAEAIESATGLPYKAVISEQIFKPLGMDSATTTLAGLKQSRNWARPHNSRGMPVSDVKPTYYRVPAAAGVNSSVVDLAKWMQAQFGEETPLGAEVVQSTHTPRIATPYEDRKMRRYYGALTNASYGLGWRIYDFEGHRVVGHRGAVQGYRAHILFDPELKTGVAVLWNSSHYRPSGLALEVFDQVYDRPRRDWMRLAPRYNRYARGNVNQGPVYEGSGSR